MFVEIRSTSEKKLAFLAKNYAIERENCIKTICVFLSVLIRPYGCVILVPFRKCLFQFPLNNFRGHF